MITIATVKEVSELITYIPTTIYLFIERGCNQVYHEWDKVLEEYGDYEVDGIMLDAHKEEISLVIVERKEK